MDLSIRPATTHDLEEIRYWQEADSGMAASRETFGTAGTTIRLDRPDNGWVAESDHELVAYATFEEGRAHDAYIAFIVKPAVRRQGIAKTFIPMLLERPELNQFSKIIGALHFGDTAAEKVLRRAGFYQTGYDENGLIIFERR